MPPRALQVCAYPSCTQVTPRRYCEEHQRIQTAVRNAHHPDWQRLYKTARWQRIRRIQLATEPWCAECLSVGIYEPAVDVDHIEPHRGDYKKFFTGPYQSLCKACHSRKTALEVNGRGG